MQEEIGGWVKVGKPIIIPHQPREYRRVYYNFNNMEENMAENIKASASNGFTISATPDNFYGPGLVGSLTKMWHQVKIDKVTNGFIIEIGCKKFVDTDWDKLAKKLGEYWKDPAAAEKKYCR